MKATFDPPIEATPLHFAPGEPLERTPRLVGRAPELRRMLGLLRRARGGRSSALLLSGASGSGKSRLLAELQEIAPREGFEVRFHGGSRELEIPGLWFGTAGVPPMRETSPPPVGFASGLFAHLGSSEARGSLARVRLPREVASGTSRTGQARAAARLCAEILEASEERPQLLLLDDFQWADVGSIQTLDLLLRNARRNRLAVVVAAEPEQVSAGTRPPPASTWIAEAVDGALLDRLVLGPLPSRATAALAGGALGETVLPGRVLRELELLLHRVGGSPGHFLEAVRRLKEDRVLRVVRGKITLTGPAPDDVDQGIVSHYLSPQLRSSLHERLARIDLGELRFLAAASLIGPEFELAPLAAALAISPAAALEEAHRIETRWGLVRPGSRPSLWSLFPPALETLLPSFLPAPERQRMAGELARWWEARAPRESRRIAALFRLAGESPRGVAWSRRALRDAFDRREFDQVPELARELVDSLDPPGVLSPEVVEELLRIYVGLRSEMADHASLELVRWLRTQAHTPQLELDLESYVADAELLVDISLATTRLDALETEVARTHRPLSAPARAVADVLHAYLLCVRGQPAEAARLAGRGARVLARTGDGFHACFGFQLEGWSLGCLRRLEPMLRAIQRGRKLASKHGLLGKSIGLALLETETLALAEKGDFHGAVKLLRAALRQTEPGTGLRGQGQSRSTLALLLLELQEPRAAYEEAAAALDLGRKERFAPLIAQAQFARALVYCRERRWEEGGRVMAEARELYAQPGNSWLLPVTELLLCRTSAELGEPAAALERLRSWASPPLGEPAGAASRIWEATYRVTLARTLELTGDTRTAEREFRGAFRFARRAHQLSLALESLEALVRLTAPTRPARAAAYAERLRRMCERNRIRWSPFVGPPEPGGALEPEPHAAGGVGARLLRQLLSSGRTSEGAGAAAGRTAWSERALAAALGLPRERFSQTLRRLEARGLVRRERRRLPGARRAVYVFELTAEGRATARDL
ncbi:MAG: ATP-binding protein [Thermoplasmata archaeon]|nr:ATP-binding protein [Thermoplasmata archaeon]